MNPDKKHAIFFGISTFIMLVISMFHIVIIYNNAKSASYESCPFCKKIIPHHDCLPVLTEEDWKAMKFVGGKNGRMEFVYENK